MSSIHCICRRVAGFVGKNVAHDMLRGCNPGTFLLRFSEGEVGGVSVAYVSFTDGGKYNWSGFPVVKTSPPPKKQQQINKE